MITPEELTGEMVKTIRTKHKITREAFKDRVTAAGLSWGKSVARLCNIEAKDSWKSGDREVVAQVINELETGQPPSNVDQKSEASGQSNVDGPDTHDAADPFAASKRFHAEREAERQARAEMPPVPVWCDESDVDDDDALVSVEAPAVLDDLLSVTFAEPVDLNTLPSAGEMIGTMELDEADVSLIDLLESDVDTGVFTITNSQVQAAKRCKRKWWLAWYRGLAPRNQNMLDTRSTGLRVHRALQAWYVPEGAVQTDPRDALERVLVEDWTIIKNAAEARGHDEFVIGDLSAKFEKAASLERAMVDGYVEWLKETGADSQLKIIGSEQVVKVPLYDHVRADGEITPVHAMGLLDVRAYRTSDGARLFVDHKTVGDLKSPVALLPQNEQMLHYHLLEWLSTSDGEERCDGALYNMIRRTKRTTRATPPFYDRYEVRHNDVELEKYRRRLIAETRDILHMTERLDAGADPLDVAYPSPAKDCTWSCDFFSICAMFDDDSHVEAAVDSLYKQVDPNERYEPTKGNE